MRNAWPQQCWKSCANGSNLLRYASAIREQKKCWELLAEKFDRFQTLRNNIQQHATGYANGRNMYHPTMLRPFARGLRAQQNKKVPKNKEKNTSDHLTSLGNVTKNTRQKAS